MAKKKAIKVKAGKVAVVKLDLANCGDTSSGALELCAELNKRAPVA